MPNVTELAENRNQQPLSDDGGSVMRERDKELRDAARKVLESIPKTEIPYERLRGDIELAQRLINEPLSFNTKPTEKEARAAARRVLESIAKKYSAQDQRSLTIPTMSIFLVSLAKAIDPTSVPKMERLVYPRKVYFKGGSKRSRAAYMKHMNIAREVLLLNEEGKPGTSLVAKKYGMAWPTAQFPGFAHSQTLKER
jgi:hypothetical protein